MVFDPPLSRLERWLVWLWVMTTGAAAAGLAWGVFWWWVMFIVTIPLVFAAYFAPSLWLYLTPALLIWLALRRRPYTAGLTATAAIALIAVGAPTLMNSHLAAQIRRAAASDRGSPVAVGTAGGTIAWMNGKEEYCSSDCLRFLITGRARAVLTGPALQGPPDLNRPTLRIRLVPWSDDRGCPLPPRVKELVHVAYLALIDPDQCVAFDRVPLRTARLIFNQQWPSRHADEKLPSPRISLHRQEVYAVQNGQPRLLMRRTDARSPKLAVPLLLWPRNGADTSIPAQWDSSGAEYRTDTRLDYNAMTMVAERLYVPAFDSRR